MTIGVMVDINCNPLIELEMIQLLCKGVIFLLVLEFIFDILVHPLLEGLEALHLIG